MHYKRNLFKSAIKIHCGKIGNHLRTAFNILVKFLLDYHFRTRFINSSAQIKLRKMGQLLVSIIKRQNVKYFASFYLFLHKFFLQMHCCCV